MMKFLQSHLCENTYPNEPLLGVVKEATEAINEAIGMMYCGELFLSPDECKEVSGHGCRFLRRYEALASQARACGKNLFMMPPKIHVIQKILLNLHRAGDRGVPHLNPLGVSVEMDEDFIGRPARLSRRVTASDQASSRVLSRYLQACYPHWVDAGYIVRPT